MMMMAGERRRRAASQNNVGKLDVSNNLCNAMDITVSSVYVTCSSPGYYYTSGESSSEYKDSPACQQGDKAKLDIYYTIHVVNLTKVYVTIDSGFYDVLFTNVYNRVRLCSLGTTTGYDDNDRSGYFSGVYSSSNHDNNNTSTSCPEPGSYHTSATYTIPTVQEDSDIQTSPDLRIRFVHPHNSTSDRVLGCAMTGASAYHYNRKAHAQRGMMALGVALLVFGLVFTGCIFLQWRRRKRLDKLNTMHSGFEYMRTHHGIVVKRTSTSHSSQKSRKPQEEPSVIVVKMKGPSPEGARPQPFRPQTKRASARVNIMDQIQDQIQDSSCGDMYASDAAANTLPD